MTLYRSPRFLTVGGFSVNMGGLILVPWSESLPSLFQDFKAEQDPPWPPTSEAEAYELVKSFATWCHSSRGYTVLITEDVNI